MSGDYKDDKLMDQLRRRAEQLLKENPAQDNRFSLMDVEKIVQELQIYQIELEMQNDELRKSKTIVDETLAKYYELYDFAPVPYVTFDKEGIIIEINLAAAALLGVERFSLLNKPLTTYISYDYQDIFYFHKKKVLETGIRQSCDLEMKRNDNSKFFVHMETAFLTNRDGTKENFITTFSDISQRRAMEEDLRVSEAKYRQIVENAGDIIYVLDQKGIVTYISPNIKHVLGYEPQAVIGNHFSIFTHNDELVKMQEYFHRMVRGEMSQIQLEYRAKHKDTGWRWHAGIATVIKDDNNNAYAYLGIVRDVTEKKKLEQQLAANMEEVKQKNQKLNQAYQEIRENIETVGKMYHHMMPSTLPYVPQISLGAYHKAAKYSGGDFYDVIKLDTQLLFYMVDVMGHGLDGTILNIFVKNTINSFLLVQHHRNNPILPKELLRFLAEQYAKESFAEEYFICILVGVVDIETGELVYSNAGIHIEPIIVSPQGQKAFLKICGLPISNTFSSQLYSFEQEHLTLEPGSTVVFCTDGIVEEYNQQEPYGEERLNQLVQKYRYYPPMILIKQIIDDFYSFTQYKQGQDDVTILAIKKLAVENELKIVLESNKDAPQKALSQFDQFIPSIPDKDNLLIGFYEVVVNSFEHGNRYNPDKKVSIYVHRTEDYIQIIVRDQGEGFAWEERVAREFDPYSESERGRGVHIALMCFDYVFYDNGGRQTTLIKLLRK